MSVKTLQVEATVDKYGCLHLELPSDLPEGRVKLRVTIESLPEDTEQLQQVGAKQLASPLLGGRIIMTNPRLFGLDFLNLNGAVHKIDF